MPRVIKMTNHIWFCKDYITDIESGGQQYSIFYNPIIEEFFVYESHYEDGRLRCKNPAIEENAVKDLLQTFLGIGNANQTVTVKKFLKGVAAQDLNKAFKLSLFFENFVKKEQEKASSRNVRLRQKGRPSKPYLMEAALWSIVNRKLEEDNLDLIKRTYEKYKAESPNLKSFTISIKGNWAKIKKEFRDRQQENVTENIDPLKTFAKNKLRKLRKANKGAVATKNNGNKIM
jgi:hypothetical protein